MGAISKEYVESLVEDSRGTQVDNRKGECIAISVSLVLRNGFVVTGNCNVMDTAQCDVEEAKQTALDRAFMEVVRLEGYRQRENERLDLIEKQKESQTA